MPPVVDETVPARFTLPVRSLLGGQVLSAEARACRTVDPDCQNPLAEGTQLDASGVLNLDLYQGFDGYIELRSEGLLPTMFYIEEALAASARATVGAVLLPASAGLALAQASGVAFREDLGLLALAAFDCAGVPVPGAEFSNDVGGLPFYFSEGVPRFGPEATDASGFGGHANVPPGIAQVWVESPGVSGRWSSRTVFIRPGWSTGIPFRPRGAVL